jgi:hypothetical protein
MIWPGGSREKWELLKAEEMKLEAGSSLASHDPALCCLRVRQGLEA